MSKGLFGRLYWIFGGLLLSVGAIALVRSTAAQGSDFAVFWRAARFTLEGQPLYSIARDGAVVFKYPPWIVPFFFPFAFFSLGMAKWIWGVVEVVSLFFIGRWMRTQMQVSGMALVVTLLLYWGLWIVHALDGQVVLPMLAIALLGWRAAPLAGFSSGAMVTALSVKIFSIFPIVNLPWTKRSLRWGCGVLVAWLALSLPAVWNQPDHRPDSLLRDWQTAATSAGKLFERTKTRGRSNPGLPGYFLRVLKVESTESRADVAASAACAVFFGLLWWLFSRRFDPRAQWLGWLALVPVVHPLPWWHLFVFTFPLALLVLDRAWRTRLPAALIMSAGGIFLIGLSTEKLWGAPGLWLEMNAAKSWGTLLCLIALIQLERYRGRLS